ncbi:LOW QUALITY PROTEIN: hypothetical protein V1477_001518 [Vespula maculifrons]|uniref:Uncharacterized protein n=1 Tax=Vespula maculifrons TaxID=7453 RepID=A0ABD2CYQ1_VESMC
MQCGLFHMLQKRAKVTRVKRDWWTNPFPPIVSFSGNETDFRDQCHPKYYFVASRRRYFIWLKRADTEDETEAKAVPTALKCCKGAELIVI